MGSKNMMKLMAAGFILAPSLAMAGSPALDALKATAGDAAIQATAAAVPQSAPVAGSAAAADSAPVIVSGTIEKSGEAPDISTDAVKILSSYVTKKGIVHRQTFATYILKVDPASLSKFEAAGFTPLQEIQVDITWSALSYDMSMPTGQRVNQTASSKFSGAEIEQGFQLMSDFTTDPKALLHRYPDKENIIQQASRGDVNYLDSTIQVSTGETLPANTKVLYFRTVSTRH